MCLTSQNGVSLVFMLSLSHENKYYQVGSFQLNQGNRDLMFFAGSTFPRDLPGAIVRSVLYSKYVRQHFAIYILLIKDRESGLTIVSHYFQKQRPLAMGIVIAGAALGTSLGYEAQSLSKWE